MKLLSLIRSRNQCLQKFLEISQHFLAEVESGDFSGLKSFQDQRTNLIKVSDLFDRKTSEVAAAIQAIDQTPGLQTQIGDLIRERHGIVGKIQAVDERILKALETEKARVGQELGGLKKEFRTVKKFKSTWVKNSGDGLDRKLWVSAKHQTLKTFNRP